MKNEKDEETYQKLFDEKETKDEDNVIKIAGREIEIYNQAILNKLQKFDQIEICVLDTYIERALYIIRLWEALGVVPESKFKTSSGAIRFEKREEDIVTREGKKFKKPVNRITLTKQPEQFRFTKI